MSVSSEDEAEELRRQSQEWVFLVDNFQKWTEGRSVRQSWCQDIKETRRCRGLYHDIKWRREVPLNREQGEFEEYKLTHEDTIGTRGSLYSYQKLRDEKYWVETSMNTTIVENESEKLSVEEPEAELSTEKFEDSSDDESFDNVAFVEDMIRYLS